MATTTATQTIVGFVDEQRSNFTYEAGDRVVFRLTALPGGNFRFDLLDQLDHNIFNTSGTGDARTLTIDLSEAIVATDFDGDVVNLGVDSIRVVVENDVPSLVVNPAAVALVVDETVFATDVIQPFTNFFIVDPGADEPAVVSNYALQTTGGPSGLFDTLTNSAVVLTNESGAIVGRASDNGAEVFRVTVDASGNVTLNQSRAVAHNDRRPGSRPIRCIRLGLALAHEPDHAARDDHRCRQRRRPGHGRHHGHAALRGRRSVDRPQPGVDSDADDRRHRDAGYVAWRVVCGPVYARTSATTASSIRTTTTSRMPMRSAMRSACRAATSPAACSTRSPAKEVLLNVVGNSIVGTVNGGSTTVFTITVNTDTGFVTLTQDRAVRHDNPNDHDEAGEPTVLAGGAQITLTATIEDGDGDTDTATADITGSFEFPRRRSDRAGRGAGLQSVNLIVNGSFENPSNVPGGWFITNAIPGWEDGADGIPFEIQQGGAGGLAAQHGVNLVELNSDTEGNGGRRPEPGQRHQCDHLPDDSDGCR